MRKRERESSFKLIFFSAVDDLRCIIIEVVSSS
jgi:hypothetical protein